MEGIYESALQAYVNAVGEGVKINFNTGNGWQQKLFHFSTLENVAPHYADIELFCRGKKVLDVGAGLGSYAIKLQEVADVTALDYSPTACQYMKDKGVKNVICTDIMKYEVEEKYDVCLLTMNNIGMTGYAHGLINKLRELTDNILYDRWTSFTTDSIVMDYTYEYGTRISEVRQWDYRETQGEVVKIVKPFLTLMLLT